MDWPAAQRRLGVLADGKPGPITYGALLRVVAAPGVNVAPIAAACAKHFPDYGMTTAPRIAEFIAQCANETGGFKVFVENLNYSAAAILRTWPSRIKTMAEATLYARNPEKLANKVYARPAEGNTEPGDGWRYRGHGMLQLTFRNNYRAAGQRLGLPLEANPDLASDPATSVLIALDFWRRGKVNDAIDAGDFREARRVTNGGSIGLGHVAALRAKLLEVLK